MSYNRLRRRPNPERLALETFNIFGTANEQLLGIQDSIELTWRKARLAAVAHRLVMNELGNSGQEIVVAGRVLVPYTAELQKVALDVSEWGVLGRTLETTYRWTERFWQEELRKLLYGRVVQAVASDQNEAGFEVANVYGVVDGLRVGSVRGPFYAADIPRATLYVGGVESNIRVPLFTPGDPMTRLAQLQIC